MIDLLFKPFQTRGVPGAKPVRYKPLETQYREKSTVIKITNFSVLLRKIIFLGRFYREKFILDPQNVVKMTPKM